VEVLAVIVLFGLIAGVVAWARAFGRQVDAAWQAFADAHAGTFDPKAGPWYKRTRKVEAEIGGAALTLDHYTVSTGKSSTTFTRFVAPADGSGKLALKVTPKHFLSGMTRALGFQDMVTGDAAFDEAFTVKADDEDLARAWLTADVRQAILAAAKFSVRVDDGVVKVERPVLEKDPAVLQAAALAAASVATRGAQIRARWLRFADESHGELSHDMSGNLRIDIEHATVPLRIVAEGIDAGQHTCTRVVGRVVGERGAPFDLTDELLVEDERVKHLAPIEIHSDGEQVTMLLSGVETDEARLRAACDVVRELAHKQSPRYR
jgi:hypothetical protein